MYPPNEFSMYYIIMYKYYYRLIERANERWCNHFRINAYAYEEVTTDWQAARLFLRSVTTARTISKVMGTEAHDYLTEKIH